jgi:hypothetical protein
LSHSLKNRWFRGYCSLYMNLKKEYSMLSGTRINRFDHTVNFEVNL